MPILLSLFYFFYFAVVGIYIIFIPKVLLEVGYSASEIGIILAAAPLVRFGLPFLFMHGFRLERRSFRFTLLLMALSSLLFSLLLESFWGVLGANVLLGASMSLLLPYMEVIALEHLAKERYGKVRLFGSIGFVLVALGLVQVLSSSSVALFWFISLSFVTALCAFVIESQTHKHPTPSNALVNSPIDLLRDYRLWLGLIFMQLSFGAYYNFFTIYVTQNGISLDMTIYLWSFGVLAEILMLYFQGRFLRNNLLLILQITTLATALRWFLLFAFAQNTLLLFFSQTIHALSFALFHSAAISYLFYLYENRPLAQQYFSGFTYGLGGLLGALISGYIYEWFESYLFLSAALFAFVAFVFVSRFKQEQKARKGL